MFIYLVARRRAVKSLSQPDAHYHVCFRWLPTMDRGAPESAPVDTGALRRIPSPPTLLGDLCPRRGSCTPFSPPPPSSPTIIFLHFHHHRFPLLPLRCNLGTFHRFRPLGRCHWSTERTGRRRGESAPWKRRLKLVPEDSRRKRRNEKRLKKGLS